MKRYVAIVLSALLVTALTGCGGSSTKEVEPSKFAIFESDVGPVFEASSELSSEPSTEPSAQESKADEGVTNLYVSPDSLKLKVKEKRALTVNSNKGEVSYGDLIISSDDESVALVDASGNIVGMAEGSCEIKVTHKEYPSVSVKIPVSVKSEEKSTVRESSIQQNSSEGEPKTVVIVVPSSDNGSAQYTYTYGMNNFSYNRQSDGYVMYAMLDRWLTDYDMSNMTSDDAQMLLNTLYAKYGYQFKVHPEIQRYFEKQSWYRCIYNNDKAVANINNAGGTDAHNYNILLKYR